MGLLGLVGFALQCFGVLAWPLFALVYPLYSSIRAIETNSITDTHKINTYWVVFSLILLFEHAFMKLLEWFLLWPYIRLLIVFFLVMPYFDGALYVYKHLICPCLSMDPQIVINLFKKRKESFVRDNFLSELERYVKENGPESLEKFIPCKSTRTNLVVKEFNAVSSMDNEESKSLKPNGKQNDIKAVQVTAKKKETTATQAEPNLTVNEDGFSSRKMNVKVIEVAADREILKTPPPMKVQKEWTTVNLLQAQTDATLNSPLSDNKHKATYEALNIKNEAEPKFTCPENRTVAGIEDPESPKEVQKEWTCALCKVTTSSESILNSHLQGRKHKAAYEALKARTTVNPLQTQTDATLNSPLSDNKHKATYEALNIKNEAEPKLSCPENRTVAGIEDPESPKEVQKEWTCALYHVTTSSESILNSHLQGRKHKAACEALKARTTVNSLQTKTDATLNSPLSDNKHKATYEALNIKNEAEPKLNCPENRTVAGIEDPESPKEVQKEWTCALCQVTTSSESILNSHLQGRKHKAACEALKARTRVNPLQTQTDATLNSPLGDNKHKATNEALNIKNEAEPKLTCPENRTVAGIEDPKSPKEVQKEWTCALCQVTTSSESILNSHLQGRKHKAACEALKARTTVNPLQTQTDATLNSLLSDNKHKAMDEALNIKNEAEPKLTCPENRTVAGREDPESPKEVQKEWTCALCQVTTSSESILNSHLQGRKHKAACEALKARTRVNPLQTQTDATLNSPLSDNKHKATDEALNIKNEAEPRLTCPENRTVAGIEDPESPKEVQKEWTCALCQVTTSSESILNSHLQGRKHKAAYEALKARNQAFVSKIAPAPTAKTSNQLNEEPGKSLPSSGSKQKVTVSENVQGQKNSSPAPITKKYHELKEESADGVSSSDQKGKIPIHVEKVQSQQPKPNKAPRVKSFPLWCAICSMHCPEKSMPSHLNGNKHKKKVQELEENLMKPWGPL